MNEVLLLSLSTWVFSLNINLIPSTGVPPPNAVLGHMVYDTKNNQLIQFGGMQTGGSYLNDLASFNLSQNRWSLISPYVSTVPDERAAGALFYHQKSQQLLLYGGRTRAGPAGDFWSYDLNENSWEKLDKQGDDPGARGYIASTAYIRNGNSFFAIFGGLSSTGVDNNLYILDEESFFWSKKSNSGNSPQPQESSGIVYYKDKLYVWGGLSRFSTIIHDTSLYEFDLVQEKWKMIEIKGNKPAGRFEHFLCVVGDYLYVYLGVDFDTGNTIFDIWKINLISLDRWIEVNFQDPNSAATGSGSLALVSSVLWSFAGYSDTGINNSVISLDLSLENPIINLISPEMTGPTARMFHSLQTIQTNLWVFGGIDNDKNYLNEMWKFDILSSSWSIMNPTGDIPSIRAKHASCVIADTLTIFGGENSSGYLSDMYEYTVLSDTWKIVPYGSNVKPVGRAGACMAIADDTIYIFGGLVVGGYSNELWQFNTIDNTFTLIDDGLTERVPKLAYSKCFIRNIDSNYYFYIATGEGEDEYPSSEIHRYDISGQEWLPVLDEGYGSFSLAQAAIVNIDNYMVIIGGEQWNFEAFDTIYMVDLDANSPSPVLIGHLEEAIYATEITYFQNSIYLFGGGDTLSSLVQNFIAKRFLFKISLEKADNFTWPCSNGTYGENCNLCPEGYYSDTFGAEICKACPKGAYNKFSAARTLSECYPCKYDSYADNEGTDICDSCPASYFCPVGSILPLDIEDKMSFEDSQPDLYSSDSSLGSEDINIIEYSIISIMCGITVLSLFHRSVRSSLYKYDGYSTSHETEDGEPVIKRKTTIGGFFSIVFSLICLLFISIGVLLYITNNIVENKNLVALESLENKYGSFPGDVNIEINFYYYGGQCVDSDSTCTNDLSYTFEDIRGEISQPSCKLNSKDCTISFTCKNCDLGVGALITVKLLEPQSYSSYISVKVSSTSSIPNEISMVKTYLSPSSTSLIFRGLNPSKFTFTMTPSLFLSEISDWPSKATGYHVSLPFSPEVGDTLTVEEINFEHGVVVTVFPDISDVVLVTSREYSQTLFVLFGTLLGSVFGLLQTGGLVMSKFEDGYNYVLNKIKEKVNFERFGKNMERLRTIFGTSILGAEFTAIELTIDDATCRDSKITQSVIL